MNLREQQPNDSLCNFIESAHRIGVSEWCRSNSHAPANLELIERLHTSQQRGVDNNLPGPHVLGDVPDRLLQLPGRRGENQRIEAVELGGVLEAFDGMARPL